MKRITKALAVLAAMTATVLSAVSVSAEETTEPMTEPVVTEAAEDVTEPVTTSAEETTETETTTQTTVTTAPAETTTAETTVTTLQDIICEAGTGWGEANGGPCIQRNGKGDAVAVTKLPTSIFGDLGEFIGLEQFGKPIDKSNYSYTQDGNTITFTFKESYLKTLGEGTRVFDAVFENNGLDNWVFITIEPAGSEPKQNVSNEGSPKTGDKGVSLASSLLLLSGAGVLISRKRKN